ncbi:uncharacterized protein LOC141648781 [Silene latifolia]|uniref:uncharacterized protein LOC141648781 n=1 Tax=Silene latifolia TaxID=37657 RepID=UPI003D76AA0B
MEQTVTFIRLFLLTGNVGNFELVGIDLLLSDDLLSFCKEDATSMILLLGTFATFSISLGVKMSKATSNVYFNGVNPILKQDIIQISGLVEGKLPFRYLGVLIKTTELSIRDCKPLIDKINRIRTLRAIKLSHAGRLVLVRSVLKTFHNYWAQMFIIPACCINNIERICRNFLWDGGVDFMRSPLVAWDKACRSKKEGGLGLKNDSLWNQAPLGKLVWWIYTKADLLWVKWVNHTYLKGADWHTYTPTTYSSWYWRKISFVCVSLFSLIIFPLWAYVLWADVGIIVWYG